MATAISGVLQIPSLDLTLPIISDWSYPALQIAPCRYEGSAYDGGMVIAGHNFDSHFGNLSQLEPGDEIRFVDLSGNTFTYAVAETEVLEATAIEEMVTGGWDLTLFTCTLSGQTRFTVRGALAGVRYITLFPQESPAVQTAGLSHCCNKTGCTLFGTPCFYRWNGQRRPMHWLFCWE